MEPTPMRALLAGHAMSRNVPSVPVEATASQALRAIAGAHWQGASVVWVVDAERRPRGGVPLATLLAADDDTPVAELLLPAPPVPETETVNRAALHAVRHQMGAVPVADAQGRLAGALPPELLLRSLRDTQLASLHRLAGILAVPKAEQAIEEPPTRQARHRLPWLLVGLAGSALATAVMARYERVLEGTVAVSFFVPGLVYLADAIGTQTETLVVRALTHVHRPFSHLLVLELGTGVLLGAGLGLACLPVIWLAFGSLELALAVAATLIVSGGIATTIGIALPWGLSRAGRDPALGSGPVATVIQDVLTLVVYFLFARALVHPG